MKLAGTLLLPIIRVISATDPSAKRETKVDIKHINRIRRLGLRNVIMDPLIDPSKVSAEGEFIGYTEIYNRPKLKKLLNYLTNENKLVHASVVNQAMESQFSSDCWIA